MPEVLVTLAAPAKPGWVVVAKSGTVAGSPCRDGKLHLWSLPDGRLTRSIEVGKRELDAMTISEDGRWIAAGDHAGGYTVWDTASGAVQWQTTMPYYPAAIAFSLDAKRLAIAPVGEPVQVYEMPSGSKLFELQRPVGGSAAVVFSRDGTRIAAADADTVVRVYDARNGELLARNADFLVIPLAAAFTADGKQLLAGGGDKVLAWLDAGSGKALRRSAKLADPVAVLELSPDGSMVAALLMHADNMLMPGALLISEVAGGRKVQEWMPATMLVGGAWTKSGLLVATLTEKAIQIWRVR